MMPAAHCWPAGANKWPTDDDHDHLEERRPSRLPICIAVWLAATVVSLQLNGKSNSTFAPIKIIFLSLCSECSELAFVSAAATCCCAGRTRRAPPTPLKPATLPRQRRPVLIAKLGRFYLPVRVKASPAKRNRRPFFLLLLLVLVH